MNILTLTKDSQGKIWLDAYQNSNHVGRLQVRTGLPGCQNFRTKPQEHKGQYEPVPEAEYTLGPLLWAGGRGNYETLWPTIKSPIWVEIDGQRAIGFHLDAGFPGTSGCVGFLNMQDLKTFVNWWNGYGPFVRLYVNWGLGYVQMPDLSNKLQPEATSTATFQGREQTIVLQNGKNLFTVEDLKSLGIISGYDWDGPKRILDLRR